MKRTLFHLFLVWVVVYSVVTSVLLVIRMMPFHIALPVQTFFLTLFLVPMIMFVVGPTAGRIAHKLFPAMDFLSEELPD